MGCLTFELLVGRWLFQPEDGGEDWSFEDDQLAKILELTGEKFSEATLDRAQLRTKYFDDEGEMSMPFYRTAFLVLINELLNAGKLLRISDLYPVSIETALANYKILPEEEITPAAAFIRECLRLNSSDRPSAKELELHPWLKGAFCG